MQKKPFCLLLVLGIVVALVGGMPYARADELLVLEETRDVAGETVSSSEPDVSLPDGAGVVGDGQAETVIEVATGGDDADGAVAENPRVPDGSAVEPVSKEGEIALEAAEERGDVVPSVEYRGRLQRVGWQKYVADGKTSGKPGKHLRIEALRMRLTNLPETMTGGIRYRACIQKLGWQKWVSDGALVGTSGKDLRLEALAVELYGDVAELYDVYYRVYAQGYGWLGWTKGGTAGTAGKSKMLEAVQVVLVQKDAGSAPKATGRYARRPFIGAKDVQVSAHMQKRGWTKKVTKGATAGTAGKGLRLEALKVSLVGLDVPGGIQTKAYVQSIGWKGWAKDGKTAGTTGRALRLEAFRIRLTGEAADRYDVYYRAYLQGIGWMGWAKDGACAGSQGMSQRVEAVQVRLVEEGAPAPANDGKTVHPFLKLPTIRYKVDSEGMGWGAVKKAGKTAGFTKQSLAAQQFLATVRPADGTQVGGGISYELHTRDGAWSSAMDGGAAGSEGQAADVLRVSLTGDFAKLFDVCYRVKLSTYGWLGWARNGGDAGSVGLGEQIEAVQVSVVRKGGTPANGSITSNLGSYIDKEYKAAGGQLLADANARQKAFVKAAKSTPTTPAGYCSEWVTNVAKRAKIGWFGGDACDMYRNYCKYSKLSDLKVGMIVAVKSHPNTRLGKIYGHIGIYVGDGIVMDSVGRVRKVPLDEWIAYYGKTCTVKWGWVGNVKLA